MIQILAYGLPALVGLFGLFLIAMSASDNTASDDGSAGAVGALLVAAAVTFCLMVSPYL